MSDLGAAAAVLNTEGQILLIQREDIKAWALPGGEVERGESVAQAVVREVYEETGLQVELVRLVGIYATPKWMSGHKVLFVARPVSGSLHGCSIETLDVRFFDPGALPEPFLWWNASSCRMQSAA